MPHRKRRWLRRTLLAIGALAIVAISGALILLHTDWGREQIRRRVVAMLEEQFPGCLKIGRLDGSVLGDLHLRDVVACDDQGREAITVGHARLNVGLLGLLAGDLELEVLDLDHVAVLAVARTGQPLNLATVKKASDQPSTWDVALPRVRVRDLDVTIDRDGTIEHLDDLAIDASARLPADGPIVADVGVTGTARERGRAALALAASVWSDDAGVVVPHARLALGDATIEVDALSYRAATPERAGAVHGGAAIRAPDGALRRVAPELTMAAAIDARLAAALAVRPDAPGLHVVDGDVLISGRAAAAGLGPDRLDGGVWIDGGVARLHARATGAGRTTATVQARATIEDEALFIRDARLEATVGSLAAASERRLPVDGSARLELDGSARIARVGTQLAVHVAGRADELRTRERDLHVGEVRFDVRAAGAPRAMRGEARLEVRDADRVVLRQGRRVVEQLPDVGVTAKGGVSGPVAIDLDARSRTWEAKGRIGTQVVLGPPDDPRLLARIDIGSYRFDLPRTRIEGAGGRVVIERERIVVDGVRMRGAGATLALDATAGRGPRAGALDAAIDLRGLDLGRLRGVPGLPPGIAGTVAVKTDLRQRGAALSGTVAGRATGLVLAPGGSPVDLAVDADLAPRRVRLGVSARGRALGSLAATADVAAPRRLDDVRAWSRLERGAIDELVVRARALDLARLSELAGRPPSVEGTLDAEVGLADGRGTIALLGHGVVVPGAPTPIDLDVQLDVADAAAMKVAGRASLRELGDVSLTTAVALPARPFDPAAWSRTDLRSLAAIDATIHEIDVDESRAERLGLPELRGRLAGTVHVEPGLGPITAHLAARDLVLGPLASPAAVTLDTSVGREATDARVQIALEGRTVVSGQVKVPVGLTRALAGTVDVRAVALDGTLTIPETPVAVLTRALGRDQRLGGRVRGEVTIGGTVADPTGELLIVAEQLGATRTRAVDVPRGVIGELTTFARYRDGAIEARMVGEGASGHGHLFAQAGLELAAPESARASLQAEEFELGPLARLAPEALLGVRGTLDADLALRGLDPETARLEGTLKVTGAQAPLADTIGALRDGTIDVAIRGDRLRASVKGAVDAGRIEATATAQLTGLLPDSAEVDVTADDLTLITASAPRVDGKLHVEVVRDADRWRAVARVHDATVDVPEDEGRVLHPTAPPADLVFTRDLRPGAEVPGTRATALRGWLGVRPTRPVLEIQVVISPVTVVSEQLRGTIGGRLQVAVGGEGASVDGRISVINGKALLFDRRYGIERADLVFDGTIDPLLDIQLEYEFPQLRMRVSLIGRLSKPELTLSSDPNTYTEGELLAILLGNSPGNPGAPAPDRSMTAVAAAAAGQLVGSYFVSKLPVRIDVARYEAVTSESSAAIAIGRWISSTTLLLLRTRLEPRPDENNNEVEIETWLTPRLLFQGSGGDRGVLGADLLWNRRW